MKTFDVDYRNMRGFGVSFIGITANDAQQAANIAKATFAEPDEWECIGWHQNRGMCHRIKRPFA